MTDLQQARSFVDPTTNTMVVADFELVEYLDWLRGRPVAGSRLLANFLHEWTHRWCFNSIVGSALALLRMRAASRDYRGKSSFDDYVRCMALSAILEPVAEGLALFAEFDSYPGKSPWMSQTLTVSMLFFTPAVDTGGDPVRLLEALLQMLRRDPFLLERKSGIYTLPLDMGNPYLLGYLSVRSLWCQMAAACPKLNDRDLFLSYLRSYFYDDPEMVICALDIYPSEVHAAEAIANHLLARIAELVTFDGLAEKVERWLHSAQAGTVDVTSIGARAESSDLALQMVQAAIVADSDDENSLTLAAWMLMTLQERQICVIGSTGVQLKPRQMTDSIDIVALGLSEPLYSIPADPAVNAEEGELTVVASSDGHGIAILLRVDKYVTVVSSMGEVNKVDLELAKRHVANLPLSASLHEEFREKLENSSVVATAWSFIEKQVLRAMKDLFAPLATLNANDAGWQRAFEAMEKEGIFGLLDHDGELTRALAVIGLVNTFSTRVEMVRIIGRVLGVEEDALEKAMSLSPRCGLSLVVRKSDSVVALVERFGSSGRWVSVGSSTAGILKKSLLLITGQCTLSRVRCGWLAMRMQRLLKSARGNRGSFPFA